jgi:hypothetical protein
MPARRSRRSRCPAKPVHAHVFARRSRDSRSRSPKAAQRYLATPRTPRASGRRRGNPRSPQAVEYPLRLPSLGCAPSARTARKRAVRPSVHPSIRPSVHPSIRPSVHPCSHAANVERRANETHLTPRYRHRHRAPSAAINRLLQHRLLLCSGHDCVTTDVLPRVTIGTSARLDVLGAVQLALS